MKAKNLLLIVALVTPLQEYAQTPVNTTIPVQSGQSVTMHFDYPELIRITTWERNEIAILGEVSINGGENDDAFLLEHSTTGNVIRIDSRIRDIKKLPQRITIMRDGQKIIFRDKAEYNKYQEAHGKGYNSVSWGPDIDIHLEIKVPRNMETLVEKSIGELTAETNYGEIYSNLDVKFGGEKDRSKDFYTFVSGKPGNGPKYNFESKYGNVYLRKAGNN